MTRSERSVPWWTVWSVAVGILVAVSVSLAVDASERPAVVDSETLDQFVLKPTDDVLGLDLVRAFGLQDYARPTGSGATDEFASVFSSLDVDVDTPEAAVRAWTPGSTVVVSEALTFASSDEAIDFLDQVWAEYAPGSVERQRGPDGSLLVFHPQFDRNGRAPEVPVAIAAWAVESEALVVRHAGAESASTVLRLARIVDQRVIDEGAASG